jgi:hypothetical protein
MYLMDRIVETSHEVRKRNSVDHPLMGVFPYLEDRLKGCPRFLFNNDSINTAVELTLGRPKVLREIMSFIRIPYPVMWIEWHESGRAKLRETFNTDDDPIESPSRPLPTRIGFLLECDETGRKGMATWAWTNTHLTDHDPPNIAPISPFFDLDGYFKQDQTREKNFLKANLGAMWKDNAVQEKALLSIWETAQHAPNEWGSKFIRHAKYDKHGNLINNFYADIYGEYIMIWSIMILLTSSRTILNYEKIDNTKWNKARVKQGKAPRLDHTMTTLHISEEVRMHQKGTPLGFTRKSPRIHMVQSYPSHRGNKHWVVMPYWRGKGEIISRHVKVKG